MLFKNISILDEGFSVKKNMFVGVENGKIDFLGDKMPEKDYGGYKFRIMAADSYGIEFVYTDEQNGSVVNDGGALTVLASMIVRTM